VLIWTFALFKIVPVTVPPLLTVPPGPVVKLPLTLPALNGNGWFVGAVRQQHGTMGMIEFVVIRAVAEL